MGMHGRNLLAIVWIVLAGITAWMFTLKEVVDEAPSPGAERFRAPTRKTTSAPVNRRPPPPEKRPFIIGYPPPENYSGVPPVPPRPDMSRPVTMLPIAETMRELHHPDTSPREDLEILQALLGEYRRAFTENPSAGVNEELVEALVGVNLKRIGLIPADHPDINAKGQLTDRWGTPYFFHAMSAKQMEVSSAGPDRKWSTDDDLKLE